MRTMFVSSLGHWAETILEHVYSRGGVWWEWVIIFLFNRMMESLEDSRVQKMQFGVKHGTLFHDWYPFCHGFSDQNVLCCLRKTLYEIEIFSSSQNIPRSQMNNNSYCITLKTTCNTQCSSVLLKG